MNIENVFRILTFQYYYISCVQNRFFLNAKPVSNQVTITNSFKSIHHLENTKILKAKAKMKKLTHSHVLDL